MITETRDIATCLELRRVVFILEQGVSLEDEVDGRVEVAQIIKLTAIYGRILREYFA